MPPAFVLSQDQTLKFVSRYSRHEPKDPPTANTELQEPIPALVKRNGYEGQCSIDFATGIRSLKTPGPGAVAHMSLHLKPTMSKNPPDNNRRTTNTPRSSGRRSCCPSMLATRETSRKSVVPSGEAAYMDHHRVGQLIFSKKFQKTSVRPRAAIQFRGFQPFRRPD